MARSEISGFAVFAHFAVKIFNRKERKA